jgi:Tfp pilus assembly protein PilV
MISLASFTPPAVVVSVLGVAQAQQQQHQQQQQQQQQQAQDSSTNFSSSSTLGKPLEEAGKSNAKKAEEEETAERCVMRGICGGADGTDFHQNCE